MFPTGGTRITSGTFQVSRWYMKTLEIQDVGVCAFLRLFFTFSSLIYLSCITVTIEFPVKEFIFSFTSTTEGEGGYVFTPFCLCAGYLKKLWTDPDEILWTGLVCDKEEPIRFW